MSVQNSWRSDSPSWKEDYFIEVLLSDGTVQSGRVVSSWMVEFSSGETACIGDHAGWRECQDQVVQP